MPWICTGEPQEAAQEAEDDSFVMVDEKEAQVQRNLEWERKRDRQAGRLSARGGWEEWGRRPCSSVPWRRGRVSL